MAYRDKRQEHAVVEGLGNNMSINNVRVCSGKIEGVRLWEYVT